MATTKSIGQKDNLDRFYTNPDVAKLCIELVGDLSQYDCIIEPSAGSGNFSKQIPNCIAYDLTPADDSIIQADWFEVDKTQFNNYQHILVIGNPPFGQQNVLAINFFNEAAKIAQTIAFILPLSFKKQSIQNALNLYFTLTNEQILTGTNFTLNDMPYEVPCVFQIWERSDTPRSKRRTIVSSKFFEFTTPDKADFRIQRVGGNAGKASTNFNVSPQSNYFIKNNSSIPTQAFITIVNNTVFETINYTVGPRSLSKTELIETLEPILEQQLNITR